MKRKAKEIYEKWDRRRLIDVLREHDKLTYNDLYKRSLLTSKGIFNDRLKELEREGYVKREYEPSEEGRGKVFIKLREKALDLVEATMRRLELLGDPYSEFDTRRGRELLSESVVDTIMDISGLSYTLKTTYTPSHPLEPGMEFVTGREQLKRLSEEGPMPPLHSPVFNEYHLIRAIARYDFETRRIKIYIEMRPLLFGYRPPILFSSLEERKKLQGILKREKDNPRLYPTTGIVNEGNVKEEFEELRLWIRPLLESAKETQSRIEEEETGELEKAGLKEYVKKWMDRINVESNTLLGGVFRGEQETYYRRELIPAWTDYIMESRSEMEEKNRGH